MESQPTLLSKLKKIFIGSPASDASTHVPEMTRDQLARLKANLLDAADDGYVIGFPSEEFTVSAKDLIGLIRLAEKSIALEDEKARG